MRTVVSTRILAVACALVARLLTVPPGAEAVAASPAEELRDALAEVAISIREETGGESSPAAGLEDRFRALDDDSVRLMHELFTSQPDWNTGELADAFEHPASPRETFFERCVRECRPTICCQDPYPLGEDQEVRRTRAIKGVAVSRISAHYLCAGLPKTLATLPASAVACAVEVALQLTQQGLAHTLSINNLCKAESWGSLVVDTQAKALETQVEDVAATVGSVTRGLEEIAERQIERDLADCNRLSSLQLPPLHGGELERIATMIDVLAGEASTAGLGSPSSVQAALAAARVEISLENYFDAYRSLCRAHRYLTR